MAKTAELDIVVDGQPARVILDALPGVRQADVDRYGPPEIRGGRYGLVILIYRRARVSAVSAPPAPKTADDLDERASVEARYGARLGDEQWRQYREWSRRAPSGGDVA